MAHPHPRPGAAARPVLAFALIAGLGASAPGCRDERAAGAGPARVLAAFVEAARTQDGAAARSRLTAGTLGLFEEFERRARALDATNAPEDVLQATLDGFASERPEILGCEVEGERGECRARYRSGREAKLALRLEEGAWRLDLEPALRASLDLLKGAGRIRESMDRAAQASPGAGPREGTPPEPS